MTVSERPLQIGFDANILRHPTPRRFFLAFVEHHGAQAHVSPTAREQVVWEVAREERSHWAKRRMRQGAIPPQNEEILLSAVASAARAWAKESFMRHSAIINPHELSGDERALTNHIDAAIPASCFRRIDSPSTIADRRILAETAAAGVAVIISQNLSSIVQSRANEWLRGQSMNAMSIMFCDEYIERWLRAGVKRGVRKESLLLDIACGACLPEGNEGVEDDARIVTSFLGWMHETSGAPLRQTGILLESHIKEESSRQLERRFARVRTRLPKATRALEAGRLRQVDQAAAEAGWSL